MASKRILVIEDDVAILINTVEVLEVEGFDVKGAENGREGIALALDYYPDLILCDVMMPVMDGYEVLAELRKLPRYALTPFIFLTARTERDQVRHGMNLGADDYLTKPFTMAELLQSVRARLDKSTAISEATDEKLDNLRDNILLSMPHELRTPLTSILGFSDIMVDDGLTLPPEQMVKMAGYINEAAIRLSHLVENFLAYAQIEIIRLDPRRVDTVLNRGIVETRAIIEDTSIQIAGQVNRMQDLRLEVAPATLAVQEMYLRKIVEELVDNAFKFSAPHTPVSVQGVVEVTRYALNITNQGLGMTPDQIAQVEAYMQFEREFHEQQGVGLGLIIARRLAELHEGELIIKSVRNQETTVMVRLPLL